ncbi:MAG TPA: VWA domain-containing protein [Blastocatellia bacterium]|nr:VWA domain-containing protein [Blastocatellia bacterium]
MIALKRKSIAILLSFIQLGAVFPALASAQNAGAKQIADQEKPIRVRADEVIVDAVVLDKRNHLVSDLTANDFEIYEDGVKQQITSFRFESAASSDSTSTGANGSMAATAAPNLVSIVFDGQTTRDGALRARKAALDYIESGIGPNDYVAVFGIDLGLLALAPYTNDKETLKRAVDAFTSRESKKYNAIANEVKAKLESLVEPLSDASKLALADSIPDNEPNEPTQPNLGQRGESGALDPIKIMLTTISLTGLKVLRTFERYEREFQGWRNVSALLAIINGQKNVRAGRKSLLLFSEGFAVTPAVQQQYLSIISAANTSGVTLYAFDIAGLRVVNPNEDIQREREAATQNRMRNPNPELVTGGVSSLGRMEEIARTNVVTTLDELTEETGGFTIKNTNDLSDGMKRILEELSNHYVLTYVPANQNYRGEFRRITVKLVKQGDYRVRARRGYNALRTLDGLPLLAQEATLLNIANDVSMATGFPIFAQALYFNGNDTARQVALYVQFPVSALKFETDEKAKTFSSRFALLVLIKNGAGEIVRKLGQEFALRGPLVQIEEIKSRPQIYNRLIALAPGRYTLEAVARDSVTGKAAAIRTPFEITSGSTESLRMSSVVLSRGVNPLSEDQKKQTAHPLYLEGRAYFVPNVEESFSKARDKNLLVHFNVYAPKDSKAKVDVLVEFLQGDRVISQAAGTLPDADASGRIAYLTAFPLANFAPGDYSLRVTAGTSGQRASSTARFKVEQ